MILITGATGRIGRRVVQNLSTSGHSTRALVRSREKAERLLPVPNVDIVVGDLADPQLVQSAVKGVDSILLVSPVSPAQVDLQGNVVKAAVLEHGNGFVPYIVKISGLGTALDSYVDSGRWHAETEQEIMDAGLPFTFLRPLFFMQNLKFLIESARRSGVIRSGVGGAKIAMIDAEDIAAIATILLTKKSALMNQAVSLTAMDSVTYAEVAQTLTRVLGRDIRYEQQSVSEVEQALSESDQPAWHIEILLQFNRAFKEGLGDAANTVVSDLLGRAPINLEQYLARELDKSEVDESNNPFPS